jgi:hypothetical protein
MAISPIISPYSTIPLSVLAFHEVYCARDEFFHTIKPPNKNFNTYHKEGLLRRFFISETNCAGHDNRDQKTKRHVGPERGLRPEIAFFRDEQDRDIEKVEGRHNGERDSPREYAEEKRPMTAAYLMSPAPACRPIRNGARKISRPRGHASRWFFQIDGGTPDMYGDGARQNQQEKRAVRNLAYDIIGCGNER